MPHVTKAVTVLGLALVAWGLVVVIGQSSANQAMLRTIAEQKAENAAIVESAYREKRADSLKYTRMLAEAVNAKRKAEAQLDGVWTRAGMQVDSARAVLADSTASSVALRYSLHMTVEKMDSLMQAFTVYRVASERVVASQDSTMRWQAGALRLADSTITAKNQALQALRKAHECRIVFGIRCPTRVQSAVGGMILTGAIVVALR